MIISCFLEFSCECLNECVEMDLVSGKERGENVTEATHLRFRVDVCCTNE
jgi:hypothetical protein